MLHEMLEQMETIYSELRLGYMDMAKKYDEAMERIQTSAMSVDTACVRSLRRWGYQNPFIIRL